MSDDNTAALCASVHCNLFATCLYIGYSCILTSVLMQTFSETHANVLPWMCTKIITWLIVGFPIDRSSWTRKRRYWLSETQALGWPKRTSSRILGQLPSQEHLVSLISSSLWTAVCENSIVLWKFSLNVVQRLLIEPANFYCNLLLCVISSKEVSPARPWCHLNLIWVLLSAVSISKPNLLSTK